MNSSNSETLFAKANGSVNLYVPFVPPPLPPLDRAITVELTTIRTGLKPEFQSETCTVKYRLQTEIILKAQWFNFRVRVRLISSLEQLHVHELRRSLRKGTCTFFVSAKKLGLLVYPLTKVSASKERFSL